MRAACTHTRPDTTLCGDLARYRKRGLSIGILDNSVSLVSHLLKHHPLKHHPLKQSLFQRYFLHASGVVPSNDSSPLLRFDVVVDAPRHAASAIFGRTMSGSGSTHSCGVVSLHGRDGVQYIAPAKCSLDPFCLLLCLPTPTLLSVSLSFLIFPYTQALAPSRISLSQSRSHISLPSVSHSLCSVSISTFLRSLPPISSPILPPHQLAHNTTKATKSTTTRTKP